MNNSEILHNKFNSRFEQIPPIRVKGFTRVMLAQLFRELGFKYGAEVGVAEGIYSLVLCQEIPGLELLCVDLWDTYYRGDNAKAKIKDKAMQDEALALAHEKLDKFNVKFIRNTSMRTVQTIQPNSLDFVYIDADHSFDFVMQDIIEWSKRVKPGGIVAGHDYFRFRGAGVVDAVNAYTHAHQIHEWFNDDQRETGFFWVKP